MKRLGFLSFSFRAANDVVARFPFAQILVIMFNIVAPFCRASRARAEH